MAKTWHKKLLRNSLVQRIAGHGLAGYLWLVDRTARKHDTDLGISRQGLREHLPAIFVFWHGEHFMGAMAVEPDWKMHVMISRSADGAINAIAAEKLGIRTVRGAGNVKMRAKDKGGAKAFLQFLTLLADGNSVALTADVPKRARVVSPGLIRLARKSGRPIVPALYVTHPRITLPTWDKASLGLPFTKGALGVGAPIYVDDTPRDSSSDTGITSDAQWCALVKERLNALEQHSYAAVGGRPSFAHEAETPEGANGR